VITVLGHDGTPVDSEELARAELVVGGERHLAQVPPGTPTAAWADVRTSVSALRNLDGDGVVLASGDPGFFGPVRRLREQFAADELVVRPAPSSVQLAFARAGLPWDDALVVSAHGRDPGRALNACRAHPKVAVLTGPGTGPAELGAALVESPRELFVASRLGEPDERCTWTTPSAAAQEIWPEPNVLLVVDRSREVAPSMGWLAGREMPGPWALPDSAFAHRDGMLTKSEVRAIVLARLGPRVGDLVWDLGACSGSVAIECSRLGSAAVAVEAGPVEHLTANVAVLAPDVRIVQGRAPEVLAGLPDPDAVFVGGGGPLVVEAVATRRPQRVVVALATLEHVAPVVAALGGYAVDTVLLQAQRLTPLGSGHRLVPTNPVFVVSGALP